MNILKFTAVSFTFLSLFSMLCFAEEELGELPSFKVSFKTLALEKGDYEGIFIQSQTNDSPIPVNFGRYNRSDPYVYEGPADIVFFKLKPTEDPEQPYNKVPVAFFKITDKTPDEDLLLLFRPLREEGTAGEKFSIYGMDDSQKAFPVDTVIFVNTTSLDFLGLVNGEKADFPKGPSKPFTLTSTFKTSIVFDSNQKFHYMFENSFNFQKNSRVLMVLHPPKRRGSLRIQCRFITETFPASQGED